MRLVAGCGPLSRPGTSRQARIGYLNPRFDASRWSQFVEGLREYAWVEGQNVKFEWAVAEPEGHNEQLPQLAAELVRRSVDVIVTGSTPAAAAVRDLSSTVPVVIAGASDPFGSGLAASLAHPGGNVTGITQFSSELRLKRLDLLRETVRTLSRVVLLWNASNPSNAQGFREVREAAAGMGLQVFSMDVRSPDVDLGAELVSSAPLGADGLYIMDEGLFLGLLLVRRVDMAAGARLPAMHFFRDFVDAGGLMSYGPKAGASWRRAAYYVDQILRGAKPADLPIEQPTVFEFVVNADG
jgi:putative ABC transport system substrate-binding protein